MLWELTFDFGASSFPLFFWLIEHSTGPVVGNESWLFIGPTSLSQMARELHQSKDSIRRQLRRIAEAGYLRVSRLPGKAQSLQIRKPPGSEGIVVPERGNSVVAGGWVN
jgi:hypothetical protein